MIIIIKGDKKVWERLNKNYTMTILKIKKDFYKKAVEWLNGTTIDAKKKEEQGYIKLF